MLENKAIDTIKALANTYLTLFKRQITQSKTLQIISLGDDDKPRNVLFVHEPASQNKSATLSEMLIKAFETIDLYGTTRIKLVAAYYYPPSKKEVLTEITIS